MLDALSQGLSVGLSPMALAAVLIGVFAGIVVGALPGIGPSVAIALLLPVTFDLPPAVGLIAMVSIYMASGYGGAITAVLMATPGDVGAAATVLDGHAMTRRGEAGRALGISLYASVFGGFVGWIALTFLTEPLATLALRFGPPEYFSLGVFGLAIVASLASASPAKGWCAALIGLAISTIGVDPISGGNRFTMGYPELYEGVPFVVALIGLFAVGEIFTLVERQFAGAVVQAGVSRAGIAWREMVSLLPTVARGSIIGTIIGILPGMGSAISTFLAYDQEKRWSREPQTFGHGAPAGIAAPESANNATVPGTLIPMLALGVPGSAAAAIMMGGLIVHGIQPGPQIFQKAPDLVAGLSVGVFLSVVAMAVLGSALMPLWVRVIALPSAVLAPVVLMLAAIGAYSVRNLTFDLWLTLAFGLLGYVLRKFNYPIAPMVLALVLGTMIESNFRRSLLMSRDDPLIFLEQPISATLLAVAALSVAWPLFARVWRRMADSRAPL